MLRTGNDGPSAQLVRVVGRVGVPVVTLLAVLLPTDGTPRGLQVLLAAALLVVIGGVGWKLAALLLPGNHGWDFLFASAILACFATVAISLILGSVGLLWPYPFRVTMGIVMLALWLARGQQWRGQASQRLAPVTSKSLETALLWGALGVSLISFAAVVYGHRFTPPGPFLFDDTGYHLTAVATWWKFGDLRMLKYAFGDPGTTFYPVASELLTWVLLVPFSGSDFAARFSQLPLAVITILGVGLVARQLGASIQGALCGVLLALAIPRAFPQLALSAGNDHATAVFAIAAAHAALLLRQRPTSGCAAYAGVSLGLLAGTKYFGLVLAAPLAFVVAVGCAEGCWSQSKRITKFGDRRAVQWVALVSLLAGVLLVVGGYTYLRNALGAHNPVYPLPMRLPGGTWLAGLEGATIAARRAELGGSVPTWDLLWKRTDLWGPVFRWSLLPLTLISPCLAVLRWRRLGPTRTVVVALGPVLAILTLVFTHDHTDLRFLLGAVGLGAAASGWLLGELGGWGGSAARLTMGLAALLPWLRDWEGREPIALVGGMVVACIWWIAQQEKNWTPAAWWKLPATAIALLALGALGDGGAIDTYQQGRLRDLPAAEVLDGLAGTPGAAVAYAGWNQPYLFTGRSLQNSLYMVPHSDRLEDMTFDWNGSAHIPFNTSDARGESWVRNLELLGVEWVVTVETGEPLLELSWIEQRPLQFSKVYNDGQTSLWHFTPDGAPLP